MYERLELTIHGGVRYVAAAHTLRAAVRRGDVARACFSFHELDDPRCVPPGFLLREGVLAAFAHDLALLAPRGVTDQLHDARALLGAATAAPKLGIVEYMSALAVAAFSTTMPAYVWDAAHVEVGDVPLAIQGIANGLNQQLRDANLAQLPRELDAIQLAMHLVRLGRLDIAWGLLARAAPMWADLFACWAEAHAAAHDAAAPWGRPRAMVVTAVLLAVRAPDGATWDEIELAGFGESPSHAPRPPAWPSAPDLPEARFAWYHDQLTPLPWEGMPGLPVAAANYDAMWDELLRPGAFADMWARSRGSLSPNKRLRLMDVAAAVPEAPAGFRAKTLPLQPLELAPFNRPPAAAGTLILTQAAELGWPVLPGACALYPVPGGFAAQPWRQANALVALLDPHGALLRRAQVAYVPERQLLLAEVPLAPPVSWETVLETPRLRTAALALALMLHVWKMPHPDIHGLHSDGHALGWAMFAGSPDSASWHALLDSEPCTRLLDIWIPRLQRASLAEDVARCLWARAQFNEMDVPR